MTRDPPFARLDLITCRNLLIYLDLPAQRRVLPLFHYGLRPTGYLMLGPSESIGGFGELFAAVDAEHKIFARKATAARTMLDIDLGEPAAARARPPPRRGRRRARAASASTARSTGSCSPATRRRAC